MEADIAAKAVELGTNTDFSLFSLFFRADIVVKSVMIILILCSVYSWVPIIKHGTWRYSLKKIQFFSRGTIEEVDLAIKMFEHLMFVDVKSDL